MAKTNTKVINFEEFEQHTPPQNCYLATTNNEVYED